MHETKKICIMTQKMNDLTLQSPFPYSLSIYYLPNNLLGLTDAYLPFTN